MKSDRPAGGTRRLAARIGYRLGSEIDSAWAFARGAFTRFPNDLCMRVFALKRSGHHAVMNWLRYQIRGRHCLLNDCRARENPFRSAQLADSRVRGLFGTHRLIRKDLEASGRFSYKGTLLYNFEDLDLRVLPGAMSLEEEEAWLGRSKRRMDLLILRDPFNLLASKLRWAYGKIDRPSKPDLQSVATTRELWKVHALEFLGRTDFLSGRVTISYNDWFLSRAYRDSIAHTFGFVNRDTGLQEVAKWGPSVTIDSFDGLAFDGRAQAMNVLERWRQFEDDTFYRNVVADPELHDLSTEIFGMLPGTDRLRKVVS